MSNFRKPYELRNIKNNPDGYQIQYIVEGKSHSAFDTDLEKAKIIRDKMEKKLKIIPKGAFKKKATYLKISFIPGTNKPMPPGISLRINDRHGSETYEMAVSWKDFTGKARIKNFYACSESRYTLVKMKTAYKYALEFRKAYEQAVLGNTLAQLDPSSFSRMAREEKRKLVEAKVEKKSKITTKLRNKSRLRQGRR